MTPSDPARRPPRPGPPPQAASARVRIIELGRVPSPDRPARLLEGLAMPWLPGEVTFQRVPDQKRMEAGALLDQLRLPEEGWVQLGVSGIDLYVPALTYVFGVSRLGERRGLLSWYRLAPPSASSEVVERRLRIEALHELGHAGGLTHCAVATCAMHRALWPESVDLKHPDYCPTCRQTLQAQLAPGSSDRPDSRTGP